MNKMIDRETSSPIKNESGQALAGRKLCELPPCNDKIRSQP